MPYAITTFGSLTLPQYEGSNEVGAGEVSAPVLELPGGVFDPLGAGLAKRRRWTVRKVGELVASSAADFRTQANALRAVLGTRAKLYRTWDDGTVEWVWARLTNISGERKTGNILHQEYSLIFEVLSQVWSSNSQSSSSPSITTSPQTATLANGGNAAITTPIITVTGRPTAITSVKIGVSAVSEFQWTGSLGSGDSLVIDCGARSVKKNGANAFSTFSLTANHASEDWLTLQPGNNSVVVTIAPGGSLPVSMQFTWYNGWQ